MKQTIKVRLDGRLVSHAMLLQALGTTPGSAQLVHLALGGLQLMRQGQLDTAVRTLLDRAVVTVEGEAMASIEPPPVVAAPARRRKRKVVGMGGEGVLANEPALVLPELEETPVIEVDEVSKPPAPRRMLVTL